MENSSELLKVSELDLEIRMELKFKEISINDKDYINSFLKLSNPEISELTFANMFMWRNFYNFRFVEINGLLCLISMPEKARPYAFIPIGNVNSGNFREALQIMKEFFRENNWSLVFNRVPESFITLFNENFQNDIEIEYDNNNSDYVYYSKDLITLSGKKYDGKRNHIHKLKKQYEYSYEKLDSSNIHECKRIMDEWCAEKNCEEHGSNYCEKKANTELLDNLEKIGCKGALINVNGRFEAFTIGEMLNNNTAVIHVEKANSKINGLYTFVNQQFCENEWHSAEYINREQDLGIEGIRRAKLSYHPAKIIKKYSVIFK
ncbi:MAG: phosphatidylglycerol lysyltransferase domain-containing protein [Bacillota bacterium]|nr:phosphatidylglycerol lysyltransferase domain-containing protein [Bacillota bacterium]